MKFETKAIHVGEEPDLERGSGDVVVPIHLSSTFARKKVDEPTQGYEYSRTGNPTRDALEKRLAVLEEAAFGLAFASGMAAESTLAITLLHTGDHVLAFDDLYGGTRRLFNRILDPHFKVEVTYVDARDPRVVDELLGLEIGVPRVDDEVRFVIENAFEVAHRHIEHVSDAARNPLEEPDVRDGDGELDVPHPLPSHARMRDLDAAAVADDAAIANALVFSAGTLPILDRTEYAFAEKPVFLGLEGSIVDGFRLRDFAVAPLTYHLGGGELDTHRLDVGGLVSILFEKRGIQWLPPAETVHQSRLIYRAQSFSSFSSCTSRQRL